MISKNVSLGGWQENLVTSLSSQRSGYSANVTDKLVGRQRVALRLITFIAYAIMGIVVARLVYLQVFERGQHMLLANTNHLEQVRQTAPRGIIFDKSGVPLVKNIDVGGDGYKREYTLGEAGATLTGYIAQVNEKEIGCQEGICNELGMKIGREGVEKVFDSELRGKDGGRLVEYDARGKEVRELGTNLAEPGTDIYLSVDSRLQSILDEAMGEKVGSAVAIDMQGKVMALVSNPSYDPNLFTTKRDDTVLTRLLTDNQKQYFLNRAIAGVYPPGSVFKLVTAYAGLETGKIDSNTLIEDTGEIRIDQYRYGNWYFDQYGRKEGEINVERALARSNDVFFYKVGELIGVDTLVSYSRKFGLGQETGIELLGESKGLVPDRLWKERQTGEKWFLGNTYHMSIGQGDLQVTPAQVARMVGAAVSGRLCKLSILRDAKVDCEDLGIKSQNIDIVRKGMAEVCASGGTAFPFFDFSPPVLCKTGTAQHSGQKTESDKPHAWIAVAYPGDNPEMVLIVMLDSAGEGSYEAGPVAKAILTKWRDLGN